MAFVDPDPWMGEDTPYQEIRERREPTHAELLRMYEKMANEAELEAMMRKEEEAMLKRQQIEAEKQRQQIEAEKQGQQDLYDASMADFGRLGSIFRRPTTLRLKPRNVDPLNLAYPSGGRRTYRKKRKNRKSTRKIARRRA
jgi:hypothetical protein